MVSYESIPQFTNQLAYQSVFAPPGFSFESPFAYPLHSQSTQPMASGSASGNGNGLGDRKAQINPGPSGQVPISRTPLNDMGDPAAMSSGSGSGYNGDRGLSHGQGQGSGMALQGGMGGIMEPWKSPWPVPGRDEKLGSPSIHDLFPSPAIRLNTGDRFSQLLDQKLGMDQRTTSTAFQQGPTPMGTSTSAPPQQSTHLIPQSLPYASYTPSPFPGHLSQSPYQSLSAGGSQQNWDRLAIESNLQDYNQVQISPDLVAPAPPPSYFQFGSENTGPSEYLGGLSMPVASGSHSSQHHHQHPLSQSPYNEYPTSNGFMSAPPFPVPTQTSPHSHSMSMSSRSSPSNVATTQPGTPQVTTQPIPGVAGQNDMIWQSPFTPVQRTSTPAVPLPRHAQSQPLMRHPSTDTNTSYPPFHNMSMQGSNLLTASPAGLGPSQLGTPAPIMMGHPQSQSYPGANRWPGDMIHASSTQTQTQSLGRPMINSAPIPSFSQPLARSSSSQHQDQNQWTSDRPTIQQPLRLDQIPTSFPPAPALSKRSRSPNSQNSSPQDSRSQPHPKSAVAAGPAVSSGKASGSKRPKLSVSMSMSVPTPTPANHAVAAPSSSQGHSEDDNDKKPIIACHTCRARKLKCDGARPKCHHCSRRNEDGCVYDTVLRRRGPGKKTKTKSGSGVRSGKGDGESTSAGGRSDGVPFGGQEGTGPVVNPFGSRFEMSTVRS